MNPLSLPDIAGMLIMMGVLLWLRLNYRDARVNLWMVGLTFILIEAMAVAVFRSRAFTQTTHAIALDAYVLAGLSFAWAARRDMLSRRHHVPLAILPAVPLLLLDTLYGYDVKALAPYLAIAVFGFIAGLAYLLLNPHAGIRFRTATATVHLIAWAPILYFAATGQLRWLVYWGLTCLYLLVALSFRGLLRKDRIGGIVIVAGFVSWAACFFFHPIVRNLPVLNGIVEQIWNMQKFFVVLGMLLVLLEEQTRRRQEEAMHDALTGLPNRRLFDDRLTQALERSRRTGMSTALFAIDLNGFKQVNDTFGHVTGDLVLMQVADALRLKVRSSDTLARCGGDEFNVIVNDLARREDCDRIAAALHSATEAVHLPNGTENLTASIGYALFPNDAAGVLSLCETADQNMYSQKSRKPSLAVSA